MSEADHGPSDDEMALAGFAITGIAISSRGTEGGRRLEMKRHEVTGAQASQSRGGAGERIEVADLRERIRKLESIAACIDL